MMWRGGGVGFEAVGEIASYHNRNWLFFGFCGLHVFWHFFGLRFCLSCDGFDHWVFLGFFVLFTLLYLFSLYTWELNFAQRICNKTQVLWGTSWGMHMATLWEFGDMMTTHLERCKKSNLPRRLPAPLKERNWIIHKCMLSLPFVCMKFIVSEVCITGFSPRLMAGPELGVRGT
jgi:hypothetical protein